LSFSSKVKEEISQSAINARHCQLASLRAFLQFCGRIDNSEEGKGLYIETDNAIIYRKCFTILRKTFNIMTVTGQSAEESPTNGHYRIYIEDSDDIWNIIQSLKLMDNGVLEPFSAPVNSLLLKSSCCKRAYIKTVFLCIGSVSDPNKGYHLELVCDREDQGRQILGILKDFDIEAKLISRKKYYVVYIKEAECIVDFLNVCEAYVALMDLENLRIVKDVRNNINRQVNCDTANIAKVVNAAARQIEDIKLLESKGVFNDLSYGLREMAQIRLEHPDEPLNELGRYFDPPLGKSGVNHRLRKLSEIASEYRL
jgi:DNA-binding protein WhiA